MRRHFRLRTTFRILYYSAVNAIYLIVHVLQVAETHYLAFCTMHLLQQFVNKQSLYLLLIPMC